LAARVLGALNSAAHMRLMNRTFGGLFVAAVAGAQASACSK
jgi:hypothetical protein